MEGLLRVVVWYLGSARTLVPAALAAVGGAGEGFYAYRAWVRRCGGADCSSRPFGGVLIQR